MLRTTQDVLELRRWAEARDARPCREEESGRLTLAVPGAAMRRVVEVGWEEFEPAFVTGGFVLVYDDAPGCSTCLVGSIEEAHAYVRAACAADTAAPSAGAGP
jgi:hypothetical protein